MTPKSLSLALTSSDLKTWLSDCLLDSFIWMLCKHLKKSWKSQTCTSLYISYWHYHPLVSHARNLEINFISFLPHPSHLVTKSYLSHFRSSPQIHPSISGISHAFSICYFFYLSLASLLSKLLFLNVTLPLPPPPSNSRQPVKPSPANLNRRTCSVVLSQRLCM